MGSEFVASHIWRVVDHDQLASRTPLLNSFVPNVVWLPGQVAKLTDREGGIVQQTLQAMAYEIYRRVPVAPHLRDIAEEAWALLPQPTVKPQPFGLEDLNWFETTDGSYRIRAARLASVIEAIERGLALPAESLQRGTPRAFRWSLPLRVWSSRSFSVGSGPIRPSKRRALE